MGQTLPFAWDADRLLVTDPVANERVRRPRLSPSSAKGVDGCAARWAAESLLREEEDPFGPAPIGTEGHWVLEQLMQLPNAQRTPETALELVAQRLTEQTGARDGWPGIPVDRHTEWTAAVVASYSGLFDFEDPRDVAVFHTEMDLDDVEIGGVPFRGIVDRIDRKVRKTTDDLYVVIDYKTGKTKFAPRGGHNEHHDQLRLYILALSAKLGIPADRFRGEVYYTKNAIAKRVKVPSSAAQLADTAQRFQTSWHKLNACADKASWPTQASPLCGWCPLVATCQVAAAHGKTARIEGLPSAEDLPIPVLRPFDPSRVELPVPKPLSPRRNVRQPAAALTAHTNLMPPDDEPWDDDTNNPGEDTRDYSDHAATHFTDLRGGERSGSDDLPAVPVSITTALQADAVAAQVGSTAHDTGTRDNPAPERTIDMAVTRLIDDKPWEESSGPTASLNPNSYAATAVFALTELAVEQLHAAGFKLAPAPVKALTKLLAVVVADVQNAMSGGTSFQAGFGTRLRGALRTVIETLPLPLGGTTEELATWRAQATTRTTAIAKVALALWDAGEPQFGTNDLAVLAGLRATVRAA